MDVADAINRHLQILEPPEPMYHCFPCKRLFKKEASIWQHLENAPRHRRENDEKRQGHIREEFYCDDCDKGFKTANNLIHVSSFFYPHHAEVLIFDISRIIYSFRLTSSAYGICTALC